MLYDVEGELEGATEDSRKRHSWFLRTLSKRKHKKLFLSCSHQLATLPRLNENWDAQLGMAYKHIRLVLIGMFGFLSLPSERKTSGKY